MNANYIYDIFLTCEQENLPDLTIALAHLKQTQPIPDGCTEKSLNEFIGKHYNALVATYYAHDRQAFADKVAACIEKDKHAAEEETDSAS